MSKLSLNKLNARQREAVLHGNGPLLVLAGAGSGKTSTMAYRIAHLISERQIPGSAILGLSFTRKAAQELKERVKKLVTQTSGSTATRGLTLTTFHSLCAQILRTHAERIGYEKTFTILDQNDQIDTLRQILRQIKLDDRKFDPQSILFEIGQTKNRFLSQEEAEQHFLESKKLSPDYAVATASAYGKYQEKLKLLNAMDFDDLLFQSVNLLEKAPDVRDAYRARFRHVLVDEYQDTNPAQFRLLELLLGEHQNICVVGDDDQSIYAWRGADSTHILQFGHHFESARAITLDQNYRSTTTILDAANEVVAKNQKRHPKSLWSERGQGEPLIQIIAEEDRAESELVADEILRRARTMVEGQPHQIRPWKDFAILYRSNTQSRVFEEAMRVRQIPYKLVGSLSFLDRKEIKDTLCYWKLIFNPKDDASIRRVINWPARGIGKTTVETIHARAVEKGFSFYEAMEEIAPELGRATASAQHFIELMKNLRNELHVLPAEPQAVGDWAKRASEKIGIKKAIEEEHDDPVQAVKRCESVEGLIESLYSFKPDEICSSAFELLREFVVRMTLEAMDQEDERGNKEPKDQVTLLTLHGSKGLEYPIVFLVGMEDGLLPHQRTIDEGADLSEERRLCYVGMTRAKDQLILTRAKHRIRYGKPVPRNPSRFLQEIPPQLMIVQDQSHSPDLSSPEAKEKHENKVKDFLSMIRAQLQ